LSLQSLTTVISGRRPDKKAADYVDLADFNPFNPRNPWLISTRGGCGGRLTLEYRVDGGLSALLALGAGNSHGADHLPINNDGNRAGLRKIIHKGWSEVFSASHHLIGFGSGTPPAQRRLGLQQRGVDSVHRRTFHRVRLDEIAAPIQNGDRNGLLVLCGPRRTRVDKGARAGARNDFDVPRVLHRG